MAKAVGGEDREMVLFYSKENGGTRREETISRFRFGHTGLNSSLFIIGKNLMGKFSSETVEHVLFHCKNYQEERRKLIQNLEGFSLIGGTTQEVQVCPMLAYAITNELASGLNWAGRENKDQTKQKRAFKERRSHNGFLKPLPIMTHTLFHTLKRV